MNLVEWLRVQWYSAREQDRLVFIIINGFYFAMIILAYGLAWYIHDFDFMVKRFFETWMFLTQLFFWMPFLPTFIVFILMSRERLTEEDLEA